MHQHPGATDVVGNQRAASPRAIAAAARPAMSPLDWWVLAFTMVLSIGTGLVFGLIPALQSSKTDTAETLKEGARGASGSVMRHKVRSGLVIAEV